jgi:hypothetical protein
MVNFGAGDFTQSTDARRPMAPGHPGSVVSGRIGGTRLRPVIRVNGTVGVGG